MGPLSFFTPIIKLYFFATLYLQNYINMILYVEICFFLIFSHMKSIKEYFNIKLNINIKTSIFSLQFFFLKKEVLKLIHKKSFLGSIARDV